MREQHNQISPNRVGLALLVLSMCVSGALSVTPLSYALTCPPGWTIGYGKCYKFFSEPHTFDDAQKVCSNYGHGHIAIGKDNHKKASFIRYVVENSYPTSKIWWQGAILPKDRDPSDPLPLILVNGQDLDPRVGFFDDWEIKPGPKPYRRCLAMLGNQHSYLYPVVYGSTLRPCKMKLPFVCVQECCPAGHPNYPSTGGMLKCVNGRCVPLFRKCDGVDDCGDKSDERDCNNIPGVNSYLFTGTTSGSFSLNSYGSYDYYQWSIEVIPGHQIVANISNLFIEKDSDILEVWCGGRSLDKSALVMRYSGEHTFVGPLRCLSAFMTFVFYSDFNTQQSGFSVSWAATLLPPRQILHADTNSKGLIIMNPIPKGSRREWKIQTNNKWLIVTLVRKRLKLPKGATLSVYDGDSYDDQLLFEYIAGEEDTEDWLSAHYIQSSGQYMSLCLWTPLEGHYGELEFEYYAGCYVELAATHAIIQNAGRYDTSPYPNFMHCTYHITTNSTLLDGVTGQYEFLEIIIRNVDIDPKDRLVVITDGVEVYDTDNTGPGVLPNSIPALDQSVTVKFWTSGLRNDKGFYIGLSTGCEDLSFTPETIKSPDPLQFNQGSIITIRCPAGYYLAQQHYSPTTPNPGPIQIQCLASGWNTPQKPDCYKQVCPDLPVVANAFIPDQTSSPFDGYEFGDEVRYECYAGFAFSTATTSVECVSNGAGGVMWSNPRPFCGGATNCPDLPDTITNGVVNIVFGNTDTELYATLEYICNNGYVLDGGANDPDDTRYRVCVSGQWLPPTTVATAPRCRRKKCHLPLIPNAVPWGAPPDIDYEEIRPVNCQVGFERNGPTDIECLADQTFTTLPTCTDMNECSPPNNPSNNPCGDHGHCINTPGSFKCWCDEDFELSGETNCVDIDDCIGTNNIGPCDSIHGACTDDPIDGGYTCSCITAGYQLYQFEGFNGFNNPPNDDATKKNTKYQVDHTCVLRECSYDHNNPPITGSILLRSKQSYHVNDMIAFLCEAPRVPSTSPLRSTCDVNGNWVPPLSGPGSISCDIGQCRVPTNNFDDATPIYSDPTGTLAPDTLVDAGTVVTLTCNMAPGRPTQLTFQRVCVWDKDSGTYQFEGDQPFQCPSTKCLEPAIAFSIGDGTVTYQGSSPSPPLCAGSQYLITCNAGSVFTGSTGNANNQLVVCGDDGYYIIGDAYCSAGQCNNPLSVPGTTQTENGYAVGTITTYTCTQPGFDLRPTSFTGFTCTANTGVGDPFWVPSPSTLVNSLECVDIQAPVVSNCPSDFQVPLNSIVNLPLPSATDNDGPPVFTPSFDSQNQHFTTGSPLIISPLVVTWTVRGQDSNSPADTSCTYTVTAQDQTPPDINIPDSFVYYATSTSAVDIATELSGFVFSSDSANSVSFSPTQFIPSQSSTVTVQVQVTVTDTAGLTNTASFFIIVKASCSWVPLPDPANGQTACTGNTCEATCGAGYEYRRGNAIVSSYTFTCSNDVWQSPDESFIPDGIVPQCSAIQDGVNELLLRYRWNINANEDDPQGCRTTYVEYFQQQASSVSNDFECVNVGTTVQTPVELSSMATGAPGQIHILTIEFKITLIPAASLTTEAEQQSAFVACKDKINTDIGVEINPHPSVRTMPGNAAVCQLAFLSPVASGAIGDPAIDCPPGTITDGIGGCVGCPAGSYTDDTTGCQACAKDTFSSSPGSGVCADCPSGQGTAGIGRTTCESTCSTIGTQTGVHGVSLTGVQPCSQCPLNQHVSTTSPNTLCQACPGPSVQNPAGTGTNSPGAATAAQCLGICPAGEVSPTGLETCAECPVGTFQSNPRQRTCTYCTDPLTSTTSTGNQGGSACFTLAQLPALCTGVNCNNGDCVIRNRRPFCNCNAGWTGEFCLTDINDCDPSPCNRGTCNDAVNGYTCTNCPNGFSGTDCDVNSNCNVSPCGANGECQTIEADPGYKCICEANFGGPTCATAADPCVDGSCAQGTCSDLGTIRYRCTCNPGWTGVDCNEQIDECLSDPCRNDGDCVDLTNAYRCDCTSSWTGTNCQTHLDTCSTPSQCVGNQCIVDYMDGPSKCRCDKEDNYQRVDNLVTPSFPEAPEVGAQCELILSCSQPANTGACINGGQCVNPSDPTGIFTCGQCDPGWEGQRCQISIDECEGLPCQNNAICTDGHLGYTCDCTPGYTGDNCDIDIDECDVPALACNPLGTETEIDGLCYCECICRPGYTGDQCETDYNDCGVDSCLFSGTCTDDVNAFSCECTGDRFGDICQMSPIPCQTNPCQNNGQCRPLDLCACEVGSYGSNCNSLTDICTDVTGYCQNGGTCTTLTETSARCTCPPAFTGDRCDVKVNACENNICRNGGTCVSSLDDFECSCGIGYSGPTCEIGPDDCAASDCGNNGECINSPYGRLCCCEPGYGGAQCEKHINRDFDLHCDGYKDGRSIVYQLNPFKLMSDSFTIAVWVRYKPDTTDDGIDDATGVFASLYRADEPYNNPTDPFEDKDIVLTMDESKVIVYLPGGGSPQVYPYKQPNDEIYEINDGQWYRVVVTCNGTTGLLTVYVNTVRVAQEVLSKTDYLEFAWMALGSGFNNIAGTYFDSFEGSLSQVLVWDWELSSWDVVEITAVPVSPNPQIPIEEGLVLDDARWVLHPGCWLKSPTKAGKPYTPLPPEQPKPRFINCPEEPVTIIGTERRTVVEWPELEAENTATSIWCRFKSGRGFTWGLYTNVCIIKNAQGFTATCKFDIVVRKLNCPDMIIYDGELPPTCEYLSEYGGVRICKYECPDPADRVISVAQPQSYMCDKLGSFNPRYIYNEGRLPACGVETEYEVLYDLVIQVSYPNVSLCQAVMEVGGISEELRVRIKEINDRSTYINPDGDLTGSPLCEEADCSDVVMTVDCPGTHITMEFHYTPRDITYDSPTAPPVRYDNARDLLQEVLLDDELLDSDRVHEGKADPTSLCFDKFPVCRSGHGYLKELCVVCAKGQYAPKKDEPCRMCPPGSYQDSPASTHCIPCLDGKTTEYWGAVSEAECIWECQPGEYYNIDFRKCKPCPIGSYSDKPGMTRCCEPCPAYETTRYEGSKSKDKCVVTCPDGHMLLYGDHCVPCERGTYRQQDLQDECQPCPYGFTTLHSGSVYLEDCSFPDCSPGSYVNSSDCLPCPIGYYQPAPSQLECIKCPPDQITLNVGSTKLAHCIYACPPGAELIDGKKCKPCEIGYYKESGLPDEFCEPCPDGVITQTTGSSSIAKCMVPACEPGEFLDNNQNLCKPCAVDTYQPEYWQTFCKECPPGTSTGSLLGSDSASDCKRYCPAGQEDQGGICLPCPLGTWKGVGSHAPCTNCSGGRYTAGTGSTSEDQCDREHCYPGKYLTTDLVCEECKRGYYQPEYQQTWCLPCHNGLTTIGTGNDADSDCILDCYSGQGWDLELERCRLCPQGTYRTQGVEDLCMECPRGYTTAAEGSYTAADCSLVACYPGYYLVVDANVCKECPKGTYQPDKYKVSCKHCPPGTTTVNEASTNHTDCKRDCPAGYETDAYYNCKPCKRGYYRSKHDGLDCKRCPTGTTTLQEGATSEKQCTLGDCWAGHYQDGHVCRPCPRGTYQPNKWQPSCIPCGKYYTTPTTGSTSAHNCTVKATCNITCISYSLGGVCEATEHGHVCVCRPGWTGHHPDCIPLCSTKYCTNYEDCHTDDQGLPYCRCRPGWESKCKDESPTDLAILIGAPIAGGVIFILLICIGLFACGCCSCKQGGRRYHHYSNKSSPTPSIYSSTCAVATPAQTLFQHPCIRYAAQPMNQQPYNPTVPVVPTNGNEPTVIRIHTNAPQPVQPAPPQQNAGISIDYGYSNPKLNSQFKFFEDQPANKLSNNIRDPNVATMNFD